MTVAFVILEHFCFAFNVYAYVMFFFFFFQAEDGIRDYKVTGVQTCALPISQNAMGGDEFGRFDKVMRGLLAVPYQELQEELAKDQKKKARKKRAKSKASEIGRASCRERV